MALPNYYKKLLSTGPLWTLVFLSFIWGYNWVVMKVALNDSGPFDFAALRSVLGALSLILVLLVLRKRFWPKNIGAIFFLGLFQTAGFTGFAVWALKSGGAGKVAFLTFTMPFWAMLFAWFSLNERVKGLQWLAILFALLGLLLILEPWSLDGSFKSETLAVLAGISWAISVIIAKKIREEDPGIDLLTLTTWQMFFGSIPLVITALFVYEPPIKWTASYIGALAYNAVPANALAWLLWLYILKKLSAGVASLSTLAIPVVGMLSSWVQLVEKPSQSEIFGIVSIALGLVVLSSSALFSKKHVRAGSDYSN